MPLIIPNINPSSIAQVSDSSTISEDSLRELDASTIATEISRIQNSISHLERSNQELNQFANSTDPQDGLEETDRLELRSSIEENQGVIYRKNDLVARLESILMEKTGVSSDNPHYAISNNPTSNLSSSTIQNDLNSRARQVISRSMVDQQSQNTDASPNQTQSQNMEGEEGMHL